MSLYTNFINAMIQADKEIGFINVKHTKTKKPERVSLGADYKVPSPISGMIAKKTQNAQKIFYSSGNKGYKIYYPKEVFMRALELCRYEVPFKI